MKGLWVLLKAQVKSLSEQGSSALPDYKQYVMTPSELLLCVLQGCAVCFITGVLFYRSIWGVLLLSPYVIVHYCKKSHQALENRRWQTNLQFCDGLYSLSSSLEAGYSIESAVHEAIRDLLLIYKETDIIVIEFRHICRHIDNNGTVEAAFGDFAARSGIEDICSFAEVFVTAKRMGGNLIAIMHSTAAVVRTKVDTKREIATMIAAKRYEVTVMKIIPFAILAYLWAFSPDMTDGLYKDAVGAIMMTILLGMYYGISRLADRLTHIEL